MEYKPTNDTTKPFQRHDVEDPFVDSVVINDVPSFIDYTVKVWAQNEEGRAVVAPHAVYGKSGESG